jgi:hypothetical protein
MTGPRAAILEIMEGVDALDMDAAAKRQVRSLVRAIGAAHGISCIDRSARTKFAVELLSARVSRTTIRDRIISTFNVSRPQAYRIISNALQLSQKRAGNETTSDSNNVNQ